MARLLLDALRIADRPLGSGDLTRFVMVARGAEDFHRQRLRVYKSLDKLRSRGLVSGIAEGKRLLWGLARNDA
ncbi:hypothetical protein OF829_19745 [Sphingomonas sp. LB-2]|uniref:hypothetical protein n=1 Tax=Sphingomonas caeni TaxID=2984949 RepID=UPI002231932C|nr:hypothetical protein [Sphingomonas caeni]MCW3849477.1 hypothetical protein [Sphingomonas caeni]